MWTDIVTKILYVGHDKDIAFHTKNKYAVRYNVQVWENGRHMCNYYKSAEDEKWEIDNY